MQENFPKAKLDRRNFPNIPSKGASRRRGQRYWSDGDVVIADNQTKKRRCTAKTVDISDSGLLFKTDVPFEPDEKVRVRFTIAAGTMPEGYEASVKLRATVIRVEEDTQQVALKFDTPISMYLQRRRWRFFETLALVGIVATLAGIWFLKKESIFYFWFDVPIFFYGLCSVFYLITRFLFAAFYRPVSVDPEYKPAVSIIIPCFNEEEWITKTVQCCLDQDYPEELLEVIVVDDGSSDNSVAALRAFQEKVTEEIGDRLTIHPFAQNQGKRHALAAGARMAKGEVIIFVDSDSFLNPQAVLHVIQPLRNPKVGAVTGRCEVENKWTNRLTRMQAVRYFIGFRIFKAAESIFDAVTCLSGPLACYRHDVLMRSIDAWENQKFLGQPATFGDDRSLTNFVLHSHYTVYQHTAVTYTIVPSSYRKFYKQQMRWKRSWLRESIRACSLLWRKEPFAAISFYLGVILPILAPVVVLRAFVVMPILYGTWPIYYLIGLFLMSMLMCTSYLFIKRSNLWIYGVPFCFFYLFVLMWQILWAIFTFWKSEWGTRPSKIGLRSKRTMSS